MMQLDHIEHADVMDYLRGLPDQCVNLVVTSPPYFGLRDYGTAEWDGGDPACDHVQSKKPPTVNSSSTLGYPSDGGPRRIAEGNTYHEAYTTQFSDVCGKCGARRIDQQIGLEATPAAYIARMVDVFAEVRRVLRDDGNVYVNLGDSYAGGKQGRTDADRGQRHTDGRNPLTQSLWKAPEPKNNAIPEGYQSKSLMLIPHRFAIAMQDDGWLLREDIVWQKPNPMPESVTDRCTRSHEYIFHFTKGPRYWYDKEAVSEPVVRMWDATNGGNLSPKGLHKANGEYRERGGVYPLPAANGLRNRRSVWSINPASYKGAHFATFPEDIPEICIKAACPEGGVVLDPFMGAGTVGLVAKRLNRRYIGCDLNAEYVEMARRRVDSIPYTLFSLMNVGD